MMTEHEEQEHYLIDMWNEGILSDGEYFYRMGLLHNYPKCCILYFIKQFPDDSAEHYSESTYGEVPLDPHHVTCIKCRTQLEVV